MKKAVLLITIVCASLSGCIPYSLVPAKRTSVAHNSMKVQPSTSWNRAPQTGFELPQEEYWTRNGLTLDSIRFVGGLSDGKAIARQRRKDDRKVPVFRQDMSPSDLVSMVETDYRIKAGAAVFETTAVKPATLSGKQATQFDYSYVTSEGLKRRGRSVIAIVNNKLYLMSLDGTALHYFDAALPEFESIVASASIP